jgi:sigma-B regulation protein RsbU (phosphoserine phosphatase)
MTAHDPAASPNAAALTHHNVSVLLVDDQAIVGEAVRRMLASEADIVFHHCADPTKAIEQANALEPTVILQDLVMPEIDGLTLVKFFRANARTRDIPLIVLSTKEEPAVKAQAFAFGANDYMVKLPDKLEVVARIRYHSKGYINLLQRNEAYSKLQASEKQLADEVAQAARYVEGLLPAPLAGEIRVDWKFIPSTQLGGDSFGYHWIDPNHFALFLLDVSGHGVGASLLSVSARNVLTAQSLPNTDFRDPAQVLTALNNVFPMEKHDERFFTIWYGVFSKDRRRLAFGNAGHPPPFLYTGADARNTTLKELDPQGPAIGMMETFPFTADECELGPFARLLLFSDGVFEITRPDAPMWRFDDFKEYVAAQTLDGPGLLEKIVTDVRQLHGAETLADDFSLIQASF